MKEKYDLVVIGGGPGGISAAQKAASLKKSVLIIEKEGWGGTCTHRGCIPTKALLICSKSYVNLKKLKRLGVNITGLTVDFTAMKKHKEQVVKIAALGAQKLLTDAGVEIHQGLGEILSPNNVRLKVSDGRIQEFKTDKILIAWGSEPTIFKGISTSAKIMTSDDILKINTLPESLIIVGGSFIGVEYATVFAELGVKVILVELLDRILPLEDEEASGLLVQELERLGVAVHVSTGLMSLKESENGVVMQMQKKGESMEMRASCALLCTGRKPRLHTDQLGHLGIAYDQTGIFVNEKMMTTVSGIYAAGDVTGGMMLAHRASLQANVAVSDMFDVEPVIYDENFIPSVVYSHPQIARVGYTPARAESEGLQVDIVRSDYGANIIARTELMGQGFVKGVFCQDRIIGATIAGDHAADLIAPLALAVSRSMTRSELRTWIIPHPTLGEILAPFTE